jgi:hypothetical protein
MGRSQGVIRRLEALLMRWSFRNADQNAQNDSASRPDAGSFLTANLVAREGRIANGENSRNGSRHLYTHRSSFDCT